MNTHRNALTSIQINLLKKKESKLGEKILFFALHYLRYIIVLTQITVIMVFLYRFKIDQEIIDLKEKVSQKQEIIKITTPLIVEAKTVETKLNQVKELVTKQNHFANTLDYIFSIVPTSIVFDDVSINDLTVGINGGTQTVSDIKFLQDTMLKSGRFKTVVVGKLDRDKETGMFKFGIVAEKL